MAPVIVVGCLYETAAILTGRIPTLTALTRKIPQPTRGALVAGACAWLVVHMHPELSDVTPHIP